MSHNTDTFTELQPNNIKQYSHLHRVITKQE